MSPSATPSSAASPSGAPYPVPTTGTAAAMAALSLVLMPYHDQALVGVGDAFDERGRKRPLKSFSDELVCDLLNRRTHNLYLAPSAFTLHVLPGPKPSREDVVCLPLHGDINGIDARGQDALCHWIACLADILTLPHLCCRPAAYHEFIRALNALDAQGAWANLPSLKKPPSSSSPPTAAT